MELFSHIHFMNQMEMTEDVEEAQKEAYDIFLEENPGSIAALSGEHAVRGTVNVLLEFPVPAEYEPHIIRIQSFSTMQMSESYYTHRKNYDSYLLLYTYSGQGELIYEGKTWQLSEGDGFLIDCRKEHTYRTKGSQWYHSDLHFTGGISRFLFEHCFAGSDPVFHESVSGEYQLLLEKMLRDYTSTAFHREFLVSSQIESLMMHVFRLQHQKLQQDRIPENIQLLQKYLENHFTENLSIGEMASFCGLSKYYMIRQFKQHTGFTPKEYVLNLRISHAKMLLSETDLPSCKIGRMVGMDNEENYIRIFKSRIGMTPGEYRARVQ